MIHIQSSLRWSGHIFWPRRMNINRKTIAGRSQNARTICAEVPGNQPQTEYRQHTAATVAVSFRAIAHSQNCWLRICDQLKQLAYFVKRNIADLACIFKCVFARRCQKLFAACCVRFKKLSRNFACAHEFIAQCICQNHVSPGAHRQM